MGNVCNLHVCVEPVTRLVKGQCHCSQRAMPLQSKGKATAVKGQFDCISLLYLHAVNHSAADV